MAAAELETAFETGARAYTIGGFIQQRGGTPCPQFPGAETPDSIAGILVRVTRRSFLIGTYTHKCKSYVDEEFYSALRRTYDPRRKDRYVTVDNSPTERYARSLGKRFSEFSEFKHLDIPKQDTARKTFLNNVAVSANELRRLLLASDCDHLVTVESDVIVPPELPELFDEAIDTLEEMGEHWGAVGGLYYAFHHPALKDAADHRLVRSDDVFSGCTCYNRALLEQIPFRWSQENPGPFPDSWMKIDAYEKGCSTWLYNKIRCRHKRGRWIRYFGDGALRTIRELWE